MVIVASRMPKAPHLSAAGRISFIVPAHNEEATLGDVLEGLAALGLDMQVIVVDDGSTDSTANIADAFALEHPRTHVIRQARGGKGSAIRAAIPAVTGEIVVIQDADMEYDPVDVPALIAPIQRGAADVVFGSRFIGGRPQRVHRFWHRVANRLLTLFTCILFNTTFSDIETGYKAIRTDVLRRLDLRRSSFSIEIEFTAKVCKRKLRIYEIPISYYGRTYDEGKKITWRDGVVAVVVLLAERFSRTKDVEIATGTSRTVREPIPARFVQPPAAAASRVV
jgi:glycosyltransferase involved in cell wall biosynthesis